LYSPQPLNKEAAEMQMRVKQESEDGVRTRAEIPPPPPPPPPPGMPGAAEGQTVREDLGSQSIEGVSAIGSRSTTTIPAGAIGNEQPITIVSEQWFSPDLQVLVLTRHSDPRQGDTTYRLVNVVRAEPDRSLFVVPADYTFKESGIRRRSE
jgi:hypothetical protein